MGGNGRGKLDPEAIKTLCRNAEEPIITAPEVAEEFGVSQQAAHQRLQQMHEQGEMARKKVGGSAVAWWPLDD